MRTPYISASRLETELKAILKKLKKTHGIYLYDPAPLRARRATKKKRVVHRRRQAKNVGRVNGTVI